jgi:dynein heavy chain, axonemal
MSLCPKQEFKSLVYVLAFFHSTIQERKKYGKIGWNVNYAFNSSDFKISYELIELYLNKAHEAKDENLPWETLRYLIGEAMYGGRVTDDNDRRVLTTYLDEFMGEFIFDKNQEFFFSRAEHDFKIPPIDMEQTQNEINQIPLITVPGVFGLHSNAEIQYYNNAARSLFLWMLEMQSSEGSSAGGSNRDEHILKIIEDISGKLPEPYDMNALRKQFEEPQPTQVVLLQEIERFNWLIEGMEESLISLKRAINGEIGMSAELELMSN